MTCKQQFDSRQTLKWLRVSQLSDDLNQGDHGIAHFWQELRWQGVKFWVTLNLIKLFGMIARHKKLLKLHETVNHLQVSPVASILNDTHWFLMNEKHCKQRNT